MKRIALIIILLFFVLTFFGQTETSISNLKKDFKIGLVLSGGGAKGFAHIGVLKAIEEAGIEIDYIGGTSMGSIIGALYASGYSPEQMEEIIKNMGFENYMDEEISREQKPFYLKEIGDKYLFKLPIIDNKISLPSGWTSGQTVMNQLSKYLQHVSNITEFDKLPIPFLCIATDLEKGESVILKDGDLALAVRASSAYPTVVSPLEREGKLLIDGGLFNNFPVEEVKNMGADFIIGVDVSSLKLYSKDELKSIVKIMEQMVSFQMVNDAIKSKSKLTDIYINPLDEKLYTTFSFDKKEEITKFGYDIAMLQIDKLKEIGALQNKQSYSRPKIELKNEFLVKGIKFTGNKKFKYAYLIEKLQLRMGKTITFDNLYRGLNSLWATDNFTQIQHKVVLNGNEGIIYIDLKENAYKSHIQIGVHYDELFKSGVLLNWTDKHVLFGNDYFSTDFVIGENFRYNLNYFVDNGVHMSVGLQSVLQNFEFDTDFINENSSFDPEMNYKTIRYSNITNRLNFQFAFSNNLALGFGFEHKYQHIKDMNPQANEIEFENAHYGGLYTYLKYDSYDNRMFPKKGIYFDISGNWNIMSNSSLIEFDPFLQGRIAFGYAYPAFKNFSTHFHSEAALSFEKNSNPFLDFHLGGNNDNYMNDFNSFYGYPFAAFGNSSYLKSTLTFRYELMKNNFIGVAANVAKVHDNFVDGFDFSKDTMTGFGLIYGVKSLAGPIQFTYSRSPEFKKNLFSIKIGYWF
jgi:NTE family protein